MIIEFETISVIFIALLITIAAILVRFHLKKPDFDLTDIICAWNGEKQIVSTSKSLLTGAFLVSSYFVIKHPSEVVYSAYLAAWVLNGGITAWRKNSTPLSEPPQK